MLLRIGPHPPLPPRAYREEYGGRFRCHRITTAPTITLISSPNQLVPLGLTVSALWLVSNSTGRDRTQKKPFGYPSTSFDAHKTRNSQTAFSTSLWRFCGRHNQTIQPPRGRVKITNPFSLFRPRDGRKRYTRPRGRLGTGEALS